MTATASLNWNAIDTVLLDMDGTLLDLRFDNYFWQELIPQQYAQTRGMSLPAAHAELAPRFEAHRGQLNWYCTDFWSRELQLNVAALKHEARAHIRWLHGAENFLRAMRAASKRLLLVTNAHHDSVRIKSAQTGLSQHFDVVISSHRYGHPKEHATFWQQFHREHPFDSARAIFIDDSLPVLRAAREFGIGTVIAVTHPDSELPPRECVEFPSVARVADLVPIS
jgi:HAD superfamily hydrolase (TIGR01509 family)